MTTVQTRLIEIARSLRPGSAERLIVLRATEQGMANLLKASLRAPAPKPTVAPSKPAQTPVDLHTMRQAEGGPTPAAVPTASATQAYIDAGAAPPKTAGGPTLHHDTALPDRPISGDGSRTLDFRPQPSLGHSQLPTVFGLAEPGRGLVPKDRSATGADQEITAQLPFSVQAIAIVVILVAMLIVAWAMAT